MVQFVFFDHYIYQPTVLIKPISCKPIIVTANYQLKKPVALAITATTSTTIGGISTSVYQLNKQYSGSVLAPLLDDTKKFDDINVKYNGMPDYFATNIIGDAPQTIGVWTWTPGTISAITGTFFSWDVLSY